MTTRAASGDAAAASAMAATAAGSIFGILAIRIRVAALEMHGAEGDYRIELSKQARTIDLMQLETTATALGMADLKSGKLPEVRLPIAKSEEKVVVAGAAAHPLSRPKRRTDRAEAEHDQRRDRRCPASAASRIWRMALKAAGNHPVAPTPLSLRPIGLVGGFGVGHQDRAAIGASWDARRYPLLGIGVNGGRTSPARAAQGAARTATCDEVDSAFGEVRLSSLSADACDALAPGADPAVRASRAVIASLAAANWLP